MREIQLKKINLEYDIHHTKSKNIRLVYQPYSTPSFVIRTSRYTPLYEIERFIREKESWIIKQLSNVKPTGFYLLGKQYEVELKEGNENRIDIYKDKVVVIQKDLDDEDMTERLVVGIWKIFLEKYLEERRSYYEMITGRHNVKYQYRLMTSEFGSCTALKNKISVNIYLAQLRSECIDAVIFHEYAHFKEMNHSKAFYQVLYGYYPDYDYWNKQLKSFAFCKPSQCVRI